MKKVQKEGSEEPVFSKTSKQDVLTMPGHFNKKNSPKLRFKEFTRFHKAFCFYFSKSIQRMDRMMEQCILIK